MKKLLYIDACIRRNTSRTERLAQSFLEKHRKEEPFELEHIILENIPPAILDEKTLSEREKAISSGDFSGDYFSLARSFASAGELLIAAPYWDMSFPSSLKLYFEHICINGLTFHYTEQGFPAGKTKIRKAFYVTTAGGYLHGTNFGYEYAEGLLKNLFSIPEIRFIGAEGLDISGNDPERILAAAIDGTAKSADERFLMDRKKR